MAGGVTAEADTGHGRLEDLPIYVRTFNCLRNAHLLTTEAICAKTPTDLMRIKNFGVASLTDLMGALAARGLSLSGTPHRVHACPYCVCARRWTAGRRE